MFSFPIKYTFSIVLLITLGITSAQTLPNSQKPQGLLQQLTILSDETPLLLTQQAVYFAEDKSLTRWTAKCVLPSSFFAPFVVGGSHERFYIICHDPKNSLVRNLYVWTTEKGFEILRTLPTEGACLFADAKTGFYTDGEKFVITLDGGKTWLHPQTPLAKSEHIRCAIWISPTTLLLGGQNDSLTFQKMESDGKLSQQWITLSPGDIELVVDHENHVWIGVSKIELRNLKDGTIIAATKLTQHFNNMMPSANLCYCSRENQIDSYSFSGNKITLTASKQGVTSDFMASVSGNVFGIVNDTVHGGLPFLTILTPDALQPRPLALTANNDVINQAAAQAAASRPAGMATQAEVNEMMSLARQLPKDERAKIENPIFQTPNLTHQQRVQMIIVELKKAIAEQNAQTQPKP